MPRIIPRPDLQKLTDAWATKGQPYALAFDLMLHAGLRIGEACALKWSHLIWNNTPVSAIRIPATLTKNHRERIVPVTPQLSNNIASDWKLASGFAQITPNDYVAATQHGGPPTTPRTFQRVLHAIAIATIGYHVNPHMLRHTFATELLAVTSLPVVQQALGHQRISTTALYTHPSIDVISQGMNRMYKT